MKNHLKSKSQIYLMDRFKTENVCEQYYLNFFDTDRSSKGFSSLSFFSAYKTYESIKDFIDEYPETEMLYPKWILKY